MWPEIFNWKALGEILILATGYFFLLSAIVYGVPALPAACSSSHE